MLALIAVAAWLSLRGTDKPFAPGQLGVFVEKFRMPDGESLQSQTIDYLSKSLRTGGALQKVEVRPLGRSINWPETEMNDLQDRARKLNAAVIVGVDAPNDRTREIVLYLRLPESTKDLPRPDLDRLDSSLVYPHLMTLPQATSAAWEQSSTLLKSHLLLASAFGASIPPLLQAAMPKPVEGSGAATVNYVAGSLALASAISASAGQSAIDQAITFLTSAHEEAMKQKDEFLSTPATVNLAAAHLMRNRKDDLKKGAELMESLRDVIGNYPDTQVQAVASFIRCQTVLAQLPPDVNPEKTVANLVKVMQKLQGEWTRQRSPYAWAAAELFKARSWSRLAESGSAQAVEDAIQSVRRVLEVYTRNPYPGEWANAQSLQGLLYARRTEGNRTTNTRVAIESYASALEVWKPESTPREWLRDQIALATVRLGAPSEDPVAAINQSIKELEKALNFVNRKDDPITWGRIQNTLGAAWRQLPATRTHYQQAIDHFKSALQVRDPKTFPMEAAHTLTNLGNAYRDFPAEPSEHERYLKLAIKAYDAATQTLQNSLDQRFQSEIDRNKEMAERELKMLGAAEGQ